MRISDWSSDVCSSDLHQHVRQGQRPQRPLLVGTRDDVGGMPFRAADKEGQVTTKPAPVFHAHGKLLRGMLSPATVERDHLRVLRQCGQHARAFVLGRARGVAALAAQARRSEEHTSELQSLMRISYAVFCLKKKKTTSKHK